MTEYCKACYPQKVRSHVVHWFMELISAPLNFERKKKLERKRIWSAYLPFYFLPLHWIAEFFSLIGLISLNNEINRTFYNNRALAVWDAAHEVGLKPQAIRVVKRWTHQMRVRIGNKMFFYFSVPVMHVCPDIDDKGILMGFLDLHGFPTPQGKIFWRKSSGLKYGTQLGFPLVVKPVHGSRSAHAVYPINTSAELKEGIITALQYEPRYYVQKYVPGFLHRFTIVHKSMVFAAKREPPHVIGNGVFSIRTLIEEKNKNPKRAAQDAPNSTLHKIPMDGVTLEYLGGRGLTLESVPAKGEYVQLAPKISIGSGGDLTEVTPQIHPDNRALFQKIGMMLNIDIVGFDIMCKDVGVSYKDQPFAIIEGNGLPFLDFHVYPGEGEPQPAAKLLWEGILKKMK